MIKTGSAELQGKKFLFDVGRIFSREELAVQEFTVPAGGATEMPVKVTLQSVGSCPPGHLEGLHLLNVLLRGGLRKAALVPVGRRGLFDPTAKHELPQHRSPPSLLSFFQSCFHIFSRESFTLQTNQTTFYLYTSSQNLNRTFFLKM